ncbi:hypothetical protein Ae706Ps2_6701 [Pseudonocardia sp. Ae706_Ps2]|nr:hypothetical protein Ae706Ps2_6701 [Pseudonocardia sp. Ae706_Ps2]
MNRPPNTAVLIASMWASARLFAAICDVVTPRTRPPTSRDHTCASADMVRDFPAPAGPTTTSPATREVSTVKAAWT